MPKLSEAARHLVFPSSIRRSVFPKVQARLADVGVELDDWQQGFGTIALGLDADGEFAATIGGVCASIPRQVGKTFTVGNLLIGLCLLFPGLRAIWTSHHGSTTKNTLQSMEGMVRRPRLWPEIANVYTNNNDMRIVFRNGSVIMFGAREHGFGRGMDAIDVLVFDEAQKLGIKALEDMVPATNQARNPHSGLVFFIGTPPRPVDDGEAFTAKRRQALSGNEDDDMVYVEFSAEADASPDDRKQWAVMNPSFPKRTPLKAMLRMRKNLPDDEAWRREAMGIWDEETHERVFPRWPELVAPGPPDGTAPDGYAVDASHRGEISVAAVWVNGSHAHVEEVWAGGNMQAAADAVAGMASRRDPVLVDAASKAAAMVPLLEAQGMRAVRTTGAVDMARACELMDARCSVGSVSHAGQASIVDAFAGAKKRPIRDAGGWGLDRREKNLNLAPGVAAVLAVLSVSAVKKKRSSRREAIVL